MDYKNFDLRYKDLRETSINSMSFKSLVNNTQKKGIKKITKNNHACSNGQDTSVYKS